MNDIHHLELREAVLHDRLIAICAPPHELPYTLALAPGRVYLGADICVYHTVSRQQQAISWAKVNWKRLLRVYSARWKQLGVEVDLAITLTPMIGRQRYMLASMPAFHAQRLEGLFQRCIGAGSIFNLTSEHFDPYIVCGLDSWLFEVEE